MCAGLLLQDDEGMPVQHAEGLLPFPFFFSFGKGKHCISLSILKYSSMAEQRKSRARVRSTHTLAVLTAG